jgi:DNA-directed RNA polymerase subunit M
MALKFCSKCGSMMVPEKSEGAAAFYRCRKCGAQEACSGSQKILTVNEPKGAGEIPVFDTNKAKERLSTVNAECRKCGHDQAFWWIQQTRSGDEPATRFFKCVRCGNTWREYA